MVTQWQHHLLIITFVAFILAVAFTENFVCCFLSPKILRNSLEEVYTSDHAYIRLRDSESMTFSAGTEARLIILETATPKLNPFAGR